MDNIVVDPSSGDVGVSSMIKCANPEAHPGSILRSVNGVLKDVTSVPAMTKRSIKQNSTVVASLATCNYILDNLPGRKWASWRQESGESFKSALAEHAQRVHAGIPGDDPNDNPNDEEFETKASVLEKSLRTIGIIGSIRVDEASGKGSIIDVIKLLCPGSTRDYATQALSRVINRDVDDLGPTSHDGTSIADRVEYIQINGKGRTTPVSDARTIVEIIWLLPASPDAKEFRRSSAKTICRVLSGDTSICEEIESRCARLQVSEEGRAFQRFAGGVPPAKRARIGPEIMELATEEQYQAYVSTQVQRQIDQEAYQTSITRANNEVSLVKSEVSLVMNMKEAFEQIRPLDPRGEIELCDRLFDIQNRAFRRASGPVNSTAAVNAAVVVATPAPTDPGTSVPTPECHTAVRGDEISIAMVSTELGIRLGEKAGQVGKKMKALYSARYGVHAAANIPKRTTIFRGKPFQENTYYSRDKDLVQQAITEC